VTGNNNSTVVSAAATPANVPPSSNGTEGEDESVIYRMCYECNFRVPYQMYVNQSCHRPCLFCRVNRRHISCMEVHSDRTNAGGIPLRWCMWCRAYSNLDMHTNESCHSFCRYCRSQIPHDTCRKLGSNIIRYTTRTTRRTVKIGAIIAHMREILRLSSGQDRICLLTLSTLW
jgi:hypothetical protein